MRYLLASEVDAHEIRQGFQDQDGDFDINHDIEPGEHDYDEQPETDEFADELDDEYIRRRAA